MRFFSFFLKKSAKHLFAQNKISFPFQGAALIGTDLYRVKKVCVMALCLSVGFLV